jgi:predicted nuclease of predicted toxin-antitoxin system
VPSLEFLANMNSSPLTVKQLKRLGWNIVRIPEVLDPRSKDTEVLHYARRSNRVLITQDIDFSMLLAIGGYSKPRVVNLRLENASPEYVTGRIVDVMTAMEKELEEGAVVSVDETSIRFRTLPIKVE